MNPTFQSLRIVIGVAVLIVVRIVVRRSSPKCAAIVLGLPLTSPLFLLLVAPTASAAQASLCSAIAAYAMIAVWASVISLGYSGVIGLILGAVAFLIPLWILQSAAQWNLILYWGACLLIVSGGIYWGMRIRMSPPPRNESARSSGGVTGYLIPVGCWLSVTGLKELVPGADFLGGFPLVTFAALTGEWCTRGRASALLIAKSFPIGQISTVAFLVTFQMVLERGGLTMGAMLGYLAAAAAVLMIAMTNRRSIRQPAEIASCPPASSALLSGSRRASSRAPMESGITTAAL